MSRLIDLINDTLQGTSHEQKHHGPGVADGHADEQKQAAPQAAGHEHAGEHKHNKEGRKHC